MYKTVGGMGVKTCMYKFVGEMGVKTCMYKSVGGMGVKTCMYKSVGGMGVKTCMFKSVRGKRCYIFLFEHKKNPSNKCSMKGSTQKEVICYLYYIVAAAAVDRWERAAKATQSRNWRIKTQTH